MDPNEQLPDVIPVFPLSGAVLLPGTHLPLHIFEPRYRAMIDDAIQGDGLVGMIQPREAFGEVAGKPPQDLARVGCAGRLAQVGRLEDGRFLVVLEGVRRFTPVEEAAGRAGYRTVRVRWSEAAADRFDLGVLADAAELHLQLAKWLEPGPGVNALAELEPGRQINVLSTSLPFGELEKQALLEAPDVASRRDALLALLEMGFDEAASTDATTH